MTRATTRCRSSVSGRRLALFRSVVSLTASRRSAGAIESGVLGRIDDPALLQHRRNAGVGRRAGATRDAICAP